MYLAARIFQTDLLERCKMNGKKAFTLVELMVVILIVGILAAVAIPMMQGRIDNAKWSEANATAGTIRTAVRAYASETSVATAQSNVVGTLDTASVQGYLGFAATDLEGTYFTASDYEIESVDDNGNPVVTVTASKDDAQSGTYQLEADSDWDKQ
jgi:prepilin-type N-terminal cleavage/methylation domain-containing protein